MIRRFSLARRAFGDVDDSVRLQLVRDKFIEAQAECSLCRHLDSMSPDTPMEDIVDRCRVWESHAEDMKLAINRTVLGWSVRWLVWTRPVGRMMRRLMRMFWES